MQEQLLQRNVSHVSASYGTRGEKGITEIASSFYKQNKRENSVR